MQCPSCYAENAATNAFCQMCGTSLKGAKPEPSADPWGARTEIVTAPPADNPAQFTNPRPAPPPERTPQSQPAASVATGSRMRVDKLGTRLDGWAELLDGAGDRAADVRRLVSQNLAARTMPDVKLSERPLNTRSLTNEQRDYLLVEHRVGASLAVYIGQFGKDLYASWDSYVKLVPKWRTLAILAAISFVIGVFQSSFFFRYIGDYFDQTWLILTVVVALVAAGAAAFSGMQNHGQWDAQFQAWGWPRSALYILGGGALVAYLINARELILGALGGAFFLAAGVFIGLAFLLAIVGLLFRRNPLAFFVEEIDLFRADDVAAMGFATHHAILEALDEVGIDTDLLRRKESFVGGQRGRLI